MYSYILNFKKNDAKPKGYRFAFLTSDSELQSVKDIKNNLCTIEIASSYYITDDDLSKEIFHVAKNVYILKSDNAGMGKTDKALEISSYQSLRPIYFPITDKIRISFITSRLRKIMNLDGELCLIFQFDNISDHYKFVTLLYQLILLKCINHKENIVYLNPNVIIEVSNNIHSSVIKPLKGLEHPIISEFNIKNIKVTEIERYVCYYLREYYLKKINLDTKFIAFDEDIIFYNSKAMSGNICIKYLQSYKKDHPDQIDGFISFKIAMKILKYSLALF